MVSMRNRIALLLAIGVFSSASAFGTQDAPKLPAVGVVFTAQDASPPQQVHASELHYNGRTAGNIARGLVYVGPRRSLELDGPSADLTLHTTTPVFYVRLGDEDPEIARKRLSLLKLTPRARSAPSSPSKPTPSAETRHQTEVPATKSDTSDARLVEMRPLAPLAPGEYAVAFLPASQADSPGVVYDFTIAK